MRSRTTPQASDPSALCLEDDDAAAPARRPLSPKPTERLAGPPASPRAPSMQPAGGGKTAPSPDDPLLGMGGSPKPSPRPAAGGRVAQPGAPSPRPAGGGKVEPSPFLGSQPGAVGQKPGASPSPFLGSQPGVVVGQKPGASPSPSPFLGSQPGVVGQKPGAPSPRPAGGGRVEPPAPAPRPRPGQPAPRPTQPSGGRRYDVVGRRYARDLDDRIPAERRMREFYERDPARYGRDLVLYRRYPERYRELERSGRLPSQRWDFIQRDPVFVDFVDGFPADWTTRITESFSGDPREAERVFNGYLLARREMTEAERARRRAAFRAYLNGQRARDLRELEATIDVPELDVRVVDRVVDRVDVAPVVDDSDDGPLLDLSDDDAGEAGGGLSAPDDTWRYFITYEDGSQFLGNPIRNDLVADYDRIVAEGGLFNPKSNNSPATKVARVRDADGYTFTVWSLGRANIPEPQPSSAATRGDTGEIDLSDEAGAATAKVRPFVPRVAKTHPFAPHVAPGHPIHRGPHKPGARKHVATRKAVGAAIARPGMRMVVKGSKRMGPVRGRGRDTRGPDDLSLEAGDVPVENAMFADLDGKDWAGTYNADGSFSVLEPVYDAAVTWAATATPGHIYRMGPAPGFANLGDMGAYEPDQGGAGAGPGPGSPRRAPGRGPQFPAPPAIPASPDAPPPPAAPLDNPSMNLGGPPAPAQIAGMSPTQVAAIPPDQVASMTQTQLGSLTQQQIAALTSDQLAALKLPQIGALTQQQIGVMRPVQVAAFSKEQLGAFRTDQAGALTPTQLGAVTPDKIGAISNELRPDQIAGLRPDQIAGFTALQVGALRTDQLSALTPAQVSAMTGDQRANLSPAQSAILGPAAPSGSGRIVRISRPSAS